MKEIMKEIEKEYAEKNKKSKIAWERAKEVMPLGVGSNLRAIHPFPFMVKEKKGCKIWDIDGNEYIDCQMSYGPCVIGHAHPVMVEAIKERLDKGTMYAMPFEEQYLAIKELQKRFPFMEMVRFANSGLEATLHAIRTARGYTGKDKILKIEGGYHGLHDYVLWNCHPLEKIHTDDSGLSVKVPGMTGIPKNMEDNVLVIPYNDVDALERAVKKYAGEIAAFILEPIMGNASLILPKAGYLDKVREVTKREGIVLIFDEVITGCTVAYGGASGYYNVHPDLITLSKAVGGGFSIAAFGGKKEIMENIIDVTPHFGTFNANPIGITACLTALRDILTPEATDTLIKKSDEMYESMNDVVKSVGIPAKVSHLGAVGSMLFTDKKEIVNYRDVIGADEGRWHQFFASMLNKGVVIIGGDHAETIFFSVLHEDSDYNYVLEKFKETMKSL